MYDPTFGSASLVRHLTSSDFRKQPALKDIQHKKVEIDIEQKERHDNFIRTRDMRLTALIDAIAKAVGIKVEQLDILEGNYVPKDWDDMEWEQTLARRGLIDVLYGKSSISVQPHDPQQEQSPAHRLPAAIRRSHKWALCVRSAVPAVVQYPAGRLSEGLFSTFRRSLYP